MAGRGRGHRWRQRGYSRRAVRFLEPTLLLLLHHGQAHGYTLLAELESFGLGDSDPSVLYRALRDMEEKGWVSSYWEEEQTQGPLSPHRGGQRGVALVDGRPARDGPDH